MLDGKTILVTGSSRGIGAAIARLAKSYGAAVIMHGKDESADLKRIARELDAQIVVFDVADEKAVVRELKKLGTIDILVNNAGINPSKTFEDLTSNDWLDIFAVNVFGVANVSRVVLSDMRKKGGVIVNIASIKALNSISGKPAYAAAKAAVMRMTSSMAEEFAPWGIRVNAIAPGFTETDMTASTLSPEIKAQIEKIPLKRMAKPEEIAEAVLFLASDKARYITGQTLFVDGGYSVAG
jgi:NAD(P)-dependent dehydrogenase (short-subunit alcohol dehydrogenase family)